MAFQLTPLHIPSLTTDYGPLGSLAANIGQQFTSGLDAGRKQQEAAQKKALLGQIVQGGDFNKAGLGLIALGDVNAGASLLQLGQKEKDRQLEADWLKNSNSPSGPSAPSATGAGISPASLISSESGGNWGAQNNAVGAGGQVGHFGRAQFGQARLQEAAASGAIPPGTSPQAFMASPELQQRAERWHWGDIDQHIARNGYDRLVGQQVNGVPVTVDGMRAVAHLGGKQGLDRFIQSGGRYNPRDANGTSLMDYLARHQGNTQIGGGQTQVAAPIVPVQSGGQLPTPGAQVAESEEDVRRLEAAQGNPSVGTGGGGLYADLPTEQLQAYIANLRVPDNLRQMMQGELAKRAGGQQPVQVAQAPAQPGAPVADVPAQGAAPAQGFAIPGTGEVIDQQTLSGSPRVQNALRAYMTAPTERTRAIAKQRLDLELADAKQRLAATAPTDVQRNYEVARRQGYQGSLLDYQKELRSQTNVNLKNEGTIPAGYRAVRDEQGNVERLEAIPGSEAATKEAEAGKKADIQRQQSELTGNVVINSLNDIDRLMKEATLPTTGGLGSLTSKVRGTASHDIANALTTIGANISFENLKQMRAASPTGGALGAVSDSEQKMLQNAWGALEQSQSESQFRTNLGRVRAIFERIVHGRTLTAKERLSGGPMTAERARGLRDEAAAAIASGAPREEVLKRLKDQFGITPEGL